MRLSAVRGCVLKNSNECVDSEEIWDYWKGFPKNMKLMNSWKRKKLKYCIRSSLGAFLGNKCQVLAPSALARQLKQAMCIMCSTSKSHINSNTWFAPRRTLGPDKGCFWLVIRPPSPVSAKHGDRLYDTCLHSMSCVTCSSEHCCKAPILTEYWVWP